jgi:ribonuclease HIII
MHSIKTAAFNEISALREQLGKENILTSDPSENNYSFETTASEGKDKVKIHIYFGKNGLKKVLQGNKESLLYMKLNDLLNTATPDPTTISTTTGFTEPSSYIGTDESGKGDFFGPLVVAGVGADPSQIAQLKKIGVKDSKTLTGSAIRHLSNEIKKICNDSLYILLITPATYNKLHQQFGNLNKLLGWAHAKVLENILQKSSFNIAISDKFGDEKIIKGFLQKEGKNLLLHQFTKAERFSAVAAASILARDRFNDWFEYQKKQLNFEIPKGASAKVDLAAGKILTLYGEDKLKELTKTHFKNSLRIKKS